jgi:L-amino acid N-acyltransferase YncA
MTMPSQPPTHAEAGEAGDLDVRVDPLRPGDWPAVAAIYAAGNATFETAPRSWQHWDANHLPHHRLVARYGKAGEVVAWAALVPVSDRCAYAGVAEDSIWTVQTGIFPENTASLALHRGCGFGVVGVRERLGQLHGRWRDALLLERRSARVGR